MSQTEGNENLQSSIVSEQPVTLESTPIYDEARTREEEEEDAEEDFIVDNLGARLTRVAGLHWPSLFARRTAQVGLFMAFLTVLSAFVAAKFMPKELPAELLKLYPLITIVAKMPLVLILSHGLNALMLFLILGVVDKQMTSAVVFLGYMEALYATILTEGEDGFMVRARRIFQRVDNGTPFVQSLMTERLEVQVGSEKENYLLRVDVSGRFVQVTIWGLFISSLILTYDSVTVAGQLLAFLWVWVL